MSLTDYARSKGAGPVPLTIFELKQRIVNKARDWIDAKDIGCSASYIAAKEQALRNAVTELEGALERGAQR